MLEGDADACASSRHPRLCPGRHRLRAGVWPDRRSRGLEGKACACDDDACEAELDEAASALAERVSAELKTDERRIEYGKLIATGQGCSRKARQRR
jgi:hypothetical protein